MKGGEALNSDDESRRNQAHGRQLYKYVPGTDRIAVLITDTAVFRHPDHHVVRQSVL
jgi:hypothetical protein